LHLDGRCCSRPVRHQTLCLSHRLRCRPDGGAAPPRLTPRLVRVRGANVRASVRTSSLTRTSTCRHTDMPTCRYPVEPIRP
jgi:hypothetical protein